MFLKQKTQILIAHQKEGIDRTKKSSAIRTKKVPYGLEDFAPTVSFLESVHFFWGF